MIVDVDTAARMIRFGSWSAPCRIGRSGVVAADAKREGDGATPLGRWPVRVALLRRSASIVPPRSLPWRWIRSQDGWCDDPASSCYNRPIVHPYPYSAERLWRDDSAYDALLVLGYNDDPVVPDRGSAIFLHLFGGVSTEGCVAVDRETIAALFAQVDAGAIVHIH